MKQKNAFILGIVWLMVMAAIVASAVTLMASGGPGIGLFSRRDAEIIERYARLEEVRRTLVDEFYRDVDEDLLMEGALRGMMAALGDSYTFYYTPEEMAAHEQEIGESYHGLGMLVQNNADGYIEVVRTYKGAPAVEAGIVVGDLIIAVNGNSVSGRNEQTLDKALKMMQSKDALSIEITVIRNGKERILNVLPGEVEINNVSSRMLDGKIGYINIFQFGGNVASDFETALQNLQSDGAESLIIDVRNNPGGRLDDVVHIADLLLPEGLIVYTEGRDGSRESYYSDENHCDLPLAVLVNEMSASASEILAAAVQDHSRGLVIGSRSYGKGVVQTLVSFESDGAGMQYTSACYYTPTGRSIQNTGVTPDVSVDSGKEFQSYSGEPDFENDVQLKTAIEKLSAE